jgi:hypothetical protein
MALDGTYAGLQASLLSFNWNRDNATIPDAIVLAETRINNGLRIPAMQKTTTLSITTSSVNVPADFQAVKKLYVDSSYDTPLAPTSPERLQFLRAQYTSGVSQPLWYAIEGVDDTNDCFQFGPDPGTTPYTAYLTYYRRLSPLASVSTNKILVRYPNLYLYAALDELGAYSDDPRSYGQRFEALLDQINQQGLADSLKGGALTPVADNVV